MPYFSTSDDCRLFYEIRTEDPNKPFIVFLNGFTQTTVYWYGQVPAFSKQFSLMLYDARGQGRSSLGNNQLTLEQHVLDLAQLLAHLKIRKTHLVGLSHGARVALAYAAARPGDVNRLVLCGIGARDSRKTKRMIDSWYTILKTGDSTAMAETILPSVFGSEFLEKHQNIMADIAAAVVERNQKDALLAQLKALQEYPTPDTFCIMDGIASLVLTGADDPLILPAEAAELAAHLKTDLQVVKRAGHSLPVEAPKQFEQRVQDFLRPPRPVEHSSE